MQLATTRFGVLEVETHDLLTFPAGLVGLEHCRRWVLLADASNDALGWLQSVERADVALAVVSPRRFVPTYQLRIGRNELIPLQLAQVEGAQVLAIVGRGERGLTLNLKAPLVINVERRLGRQVVSTADDPVQYDLEPRPLPLRKSA
jgi:flagellar assembly factor FliW